MQVAPVSRCRCTGTSFPGLPAIQSTSCAMPRSATPACGQSYRRFAAASTCLGGSPLDGRFVFPSNYPVMAVRPHEKPPRTALTNTPDLSRLFGATSIALVGASERSNWARTVLENLQGCGFEGAIHLVHPREERQFDLPCYASLAEVPGPVDVVYLLTGAATFASILAECGEKGVPWAVALSGGFKETGDDGAEREASLAASARANGVSVLGPNALGFLSSSNRLGAFGSILARPLVPGALGLVSQSGQMATQIHRQAVSRGIGMSHVVAVGNCAMVSVCDVLDFMVDDPETKVVAALLETIEPAEQFVAVARRALEAGKPLVVLKIGRNERTQRVAIAHTGVLAG